MGKTSIEWTDFTINPIAAFNKLTGKRGWFCVRVSGGCKLCYAARINRWRGNGLDYAADNLHKIEFRVIENIMREPLTWRTPRRCFAFDMTDWALIAERNPELMDRWFAMMALTPHITYQMLTKRPEAARNFFIRHFIEDAAIALAGGEVRLHRWPLLNVWLGVSVEDQKTADERIPILLQTPAAVRIISYEPALGRVDFSRFLLQPGLLDPRRSLSAPFWLIAGGESGPQARPAHPEWFRQARDQCQEAGVPFFFKQWGEWEPTPLWEALDRDLQIQKVGKKSAGRQLDGRTWDEFPDTVSSRVLPIPWRQADERRPTLAPGA